MECSSEKEVYFGVYCKKCEHFNKTDDQEPCCDCLEEPVNSYSHKPVYFKEKENA